MTTEAIMMAQNFRQHVLTKGLIAPKKVVALEIEKVPQQQEQQVKIPNKAKAAVT